VASVVRTCTAASNRVAKEDGEPDWGADMDIKSSDGGSISSSHGVAGDGGDGGGIVALCEGIIR